MMLISTPTFSLFFSYQGCCLIKNPQEHENEWQKEEHF